MFSISHSRYSVLASLSLLACEARALHARKTYAKLYREKKTRLFCSLEEGKRTKYIAAGRMGQASETSVAKCRGSWVVGRGRGSWVWFVGVGVGKRRG